jgi:hypothetical protein
VFSAGRAEDNFQICTEQNCSKLNTPPALPYLFACFMQNSLGFEQAGEKLTFDITKILQSGAPALAICRQ